MLRCIGIVSGDLLVLLAGLMLAAPFVIVLSAPFTVGL